MTHRRTAALLVAATLLVGACGSDDEEPAGSTTTEATTTTTEGSTTTTAGADSTSTTAPTSSSTPSEDTSTAVFPTGGETTYDDPVDVATAFAADFVGFDDPVVGEFQAGDSRSGEVEVKPDEQGPVTTVFVRQLGDSWFVLGSATANIEIAQPTALSTIASPVTLSGRSTAFEATVQVAIRQDGSSDPIGEGFVMGGSMGEMGPFDDSLEFSPATTAGGAVMMWTESMENGEVWEASVVRVRFTE